MIVSHARAEIVFFFTVWSKGSGCIERFRQLCLAFLVRSLYSAEPLWLELEHFGLILRANIYHLSLEKLDLCYELKILASVFKF